MAEWTSGKVLDFRLEGQGIESCLSTDFFQSYIQLQTDSNPSRNTGGCISDQSSLVVRKGIGEKRVKGSNPAQRHRKRSLAKMQISLEVLKLEG